MFFHVFSLFVSLFVVTLYVHRSFFVSIFLAVVLESGRIGSTVAGIVLIYSLGFCESLTFLARAHADVRALFNACLFYFFTFSVTCIVRGYWRCYVLQCQMDLNSIERIQEYSNLPAEKGLGDEDDLVASSGTDADIDDHYSSSRVGRDSINSSNHGVEMSRLGDHGMDTSQHPLMALKQQQHQLVDGSCGGTMNAGSCWPSEGHVEFRNIFLKYASCATPVLR